MGQKQSKRESLYVYGKEFIITADMYEIERDPYDKESVEFISEVWNNDKNLNKHIKYFESKITEINQSHNMDRNVYENMMGFLETLIAMIRIESSLESTRHDRMKYEERFLITKKNIKI